MDAADGGLSASDRWDSEDDDMLRHAADGVAVPRHLDKRLTQKHMRRMVYTCAVLVAVMATTTSVGGRLFWTVTEGKYPCGKEGPANPPQWVAPTPVQWLGLQLSIYPPFCGLMASLVAVRLMLALRVTLRAKVMVSVGMLLLYLWFAVSIGIMSRGSWDWRGGTTCDGLAVAFTLISAPIGAGVCLSMVWTVAKLLYKAKRGDAAEHEVCPLLGGAKAAPLIAAQRVHWGAVAGCALYIPVLVLITAAVPNSYSNFTNWVAARDPALTHDGPDTGVYNFHISTVEGGGKQYRFYLKFYTTVLVYYGMLYLATLVGLAAALSPRLYRLLHRRANLYKSYRVSLSLGELLVGTGFSLVTLYFFAFWLRHFYESQYSKEEENRHSSVIWARTFGQMAALFMGFLVLPLPRNFGFWSTGLGVSWEVGLKFHRWCGYAVFAASMMHQLCWWLEWSEDVKYLTNATQPDGSTKVEVATFYTASINEYFTLKRRYHPDDYTITTITAAWWTAAFMIFILAYERVRREHFDVFYYAHHFGMVFLFVAMLHGNSVWYYTFGGVSLWLVDRLIRFNRSCIPVEILHSEQFTDILRLKIRRPCGFTFKAGQFAFLNVPEIAPLAWHPFTISSSPLEEDSVTFHIKNMGPTQWTGQLHDLLGGGYSEQGATVCVDGPYGTPPDFSQYDHVVFIAGGIGVTPARSLMHTLALRDGDFGATLVWAVESVVDRTYMDEALRAVCQSPRDVRYTIIVRGVSHSFIELPRNILPVTSHAEIVAAIETELAEAARSGYKAERVLAHVCGPPGLRDAVLPAIHAFGFHSHVEVFAL
eukprot:TRINITY_DN1906_c0_g1_i1.p1 TRINITY_DN1906_c0_g1~~TRINITY_DN1906_c0_g1_i1.p1  ORF type:complete len:835 (+),score=275.95 TRINITY_DN1906_c0_g1_i1:54-2507(+)